MTFGIDWLGILDSFDPTVLEDKYINECARRNPYETCYKWEADGLAPEPIEGRLSSSRAYATYRRRELEESAERIEKEGLSSVAYKNARAALIKAIGQKGAAEYNRREYERIGEEGRRKQIEEYQVWKTNWESQRAEYDDYWYVEPFSASVHEKVVKIRKGVLGSNGKPLTQRDFAKYIGYPINKYVEAEKIDRYGRSNDVDIFYLRRFLSILLCRSRRLKDSVMKNSVFAQFITDQSVNDFIINYSLSTYKDVEKLFGNNIGLILIKNNRSLLLPRNGFYSVKRENKEVIVIPIDPQCAIALSSMTAFFDLIEDDRSVDYLNVRAYQAEKLFNNEFVAGDKNELLRLKTLQGKI